MVGVSTTNVPSAPVVDEVIGNRVAEGVMQTVRIPVADLAAQIADRVQPKTMTHVATIADLRSLAVTTAMSVETDGATWAGDGHGRRFFGVGGAAPGTYLDDGTTAIVPAGGDGSAAWLAVNPRGFRSLEDIAVMMRSGAAVTIDIFGDSTIRGANGASNVLATAEETMVQRLQSTLRGYYGNNAITVNNRGVDGSYTVTALAGTDLSNQTFAARLDASTAQIVHINWCINDCQAVSPTALATYRSNLEVAVGMVRRRGKIALLQTPNVLTPHKQAPNNLGSQDKTERIKHYVSVMRHVAADLGVPLVDNFHWTTRLMETGTYTADQLVGDGIHPTPLLYQFMGQNLAIPYISPRKGLSRPDEFIYAAESWFSADEGPLSDGIAVNGQLRAGLYRQTPGTGSEVVRVAVLVEESGLDLYVSHLLWAAGAPTVAIVVDRQLISASYTMQCSVVASPYIGDHEICVLEAASPGLHLIEITNGGSGSLAVSHVRTRATKVGTRSYLSRTTAGAPAIRHRLKVVEDFQAIISDGAEIVHLFDTIPTSRLLSAQTYEMETSLNANEGMVISGVKVVGGVAAYAMPAVVLGLNGAGFLTLWELAGAATMTPHVLGSGSLIGASHVYTLSISGRTAVVILDGSVVATITLANLIAGGLLGLWKSGSGVMTIKNISIYAA